MGLSQLQCHHKLKLNVRHPSQKNTLVQKTIHEHPLCHLPIPHHQINVTRIKKASRTQDCHVRRKSCTRIHHRQAHHQID